MPLFLRCLINVIRKAGQAYDFREQEHIKLTGCFVHRAHIVQSGYVPYAENRNQYGRTYEYMGCE